MRERTLLASNLRLLQRSGAELRRHSNIRYWESPALLQFGKPELPALTPRCRYPARHHQEKLEDDLKKRGAYRDYRDEPDSWGGTREDSRIRW